MAAKIRMKCPKCGEVSNASSFKMACPKCKAEINLPEESCIYVYRQGSPMGVAGGFGLFVNNHPFGYIGNKELLRIPLPYGTYTLHSAVGMNRNCKDMQVVLSPEHPVAYIKLYMKVGFWANSFAFEPVDPKLLDL